MSAQDHSIGRTDAPPSWLESNHNAAITVAFVLTTLYVAPIALCAIAIVATDGFAESHWALNWFAAFMVDHENTLGEFHKILLPVMATVSVATFTGAPSRSLIALASLILVFFVLTIFISVYFDMGSTKTLITGAVDELPMADTKHFFNRVRETLLTFAMMLLGIRIVNAGAAKKDGV